MRELTPEQEVIRRRAMATTPDELAAIRPPSTCHSFALRVFIHYREPVLIVTAVKLGRVQCVGSDTIRLRHDAWTPFTG
jgi:hypothetical protein